LFKASVGIASEKRKDNALAFASKTIAATVGAHQGDPLLKLDIAELPIHEELLMRRLISPDPDGILNGLAAKATTCA